MSDREVLLALYRTTGGPGWRFNKGWNTDADISSWHGVEVRDGRVVGLDLGWNNLQGPIPEELAQLTSLEKLDLSVNKLSGPIPQELAGLKKTKLTLWGNELTGVLKISPDREALLALYRATGGPHWYTNGGWDANDDISLWHDVQVQDGRVVGLHLNRNNLKGSIPKELGKLTSLTHLYLSNNKLGGSIPKELGLLINLQKLMLQGNQLTGRIPPELFGIQTLEALYCGENVGLFDETADGVTHSWALRTVESLTSLWHFLLPVLDDITDLWLLLETSGGHRGLWWTCLCVFIVADIERIYTAFFFVALSVRIVIHQIFRYTKRSEMRYIVSEPSSDIMSLLAGQKVYLTKTRWLLLDSLLWTLVGSRARSSPFMRAYGMAGEARGDDLRSTGLGLHGIDVILFFHPMRILGEFVMSFPKGHRHPDVTDRNKAERKHIAMVRAVGETLCVDSLFLALSVVTVGWDDNFTGLAVVSSIFSVLELVTELQYYVTEAEAARTGVRDSSEVDYDNIPPRETAAVNDIEVGGGQSRNHARPIESAFPIRNF